MLILFNKNNPIALRLPNHRLQQLIEVVFFLLFYVLCSLGLTIVLFGLFQNAAAFLLTQLFVLAVTLALAWMAWRRIQRFVVDYWLDASANARNWTINKEIS